MFCAILFSLAQCVSGGVSAGMSVGMSGVMSEGMIGQVCAYLRVFVRGVFVRVCVCL